MAVNFSEDEQGELIDVFKSLDVKPDTSDPESMKQWMLDYLKTQGKIPSTVNPSNLSSPSKVNTASYLPTLKISYFSGDKENKSHVDYQTWKYEVKALLAEASYSREAIKIAIVKSLQGTARTRCINLGVHSTIDDIFRKLDSLFGTVDRTETLLGKFYSAEQGHDESVTKWSCRLEDILDKAQEGGELAGLSPDDMLRGKFWLGLRSELREAARGKVERIPNFDELRIEVRRIESEHELQNPREDTTEKGKKAHLNMTRTDKQDKPAEDEITLRELKGMVSQLTTTVEKLEHKIDQQPEASRFSGNNNFRGRGRNRGRGNWNGNGPSAPGWSDRGSIRGRSMNRGRGTWGNSYSGPAGNQSGQSNNYSGSTGNYNNQETSYSGTFQGNHDKPKSNYYDVECYRCFQKGHVKSGCRVDLSTLNSNRPTTTGRR